jgi:three-Cys-motif partner protein
MPRAWGIWTQHKLGLLEDDLDAFTTAGKRAQALVYLDLFGGEPDNVARDTLEPIDGSARIALDTANPPFSHLRFFELGPNAAKLRATIAQEYPERDAIVYEGDCNETIHQALADLRRQGLDWAPTFAFIDPNGPHYGWSTLEALARHKNPGAKTKVELWILFPAPLFQRLLPTTGKIRRQDNEMITRMFGTPRWHAIWLAKLNNEIEPSEARAEYVDLMRWRLEQDLHYRWSFQLEVQTLRKAPIYHMIFATDHTAGRDIMKHLYEKAARDYPAMVEAHRAQAERKTREEAGVYDLWSACGIEMPLGGAPGPKITLPIEPAGEPRPHDEATCPYCH